MTNDSFEMDDNVEVADRLVSVEEEGFVFLINEDSLLTSIDDYLLPVGSARRTDHIPVTINIQLESVNTRKSRVVQELVFALALYFNPENITVCWYYEATDETSYQMGLKIQRATNINFIFQVY